MRNYRIPEDPQELVDRFITCDYKGMIDQKTCAIKLMEQLKSGKITIDEVIEMIKNSKCLEEF